MPSTEPSIVGNLLFTQFISPAMLVVFLGVLLAFGIISVILNYHWTKYGIHEKTLSRIRQIYFGVSAILLLALTSTLFAAIQ